jgi:galactose mutarotase-like enzyme
MIILENNYLNAQIKVLGAELIALQRKGKENVLWVPDFSFWNRISPNLFPFVGRLLKDTYRYNHQIYEMKQHGFARDLSFNIIEQTKTKVELQLTDSDETRINYPFYFEFTVIYELIEEQIEISYTTKNRSSNKMPYSVGGHPGFALNLPLHHYRLNFHTDFEVDRWLIENTYYTGQKQLMKIDNYLNLENEYFSKDAIVFKDPKFSHVTLEKQNKEKLVTVGSDNWEAIGFWTKQNAPFFCIEPWWGYADSHNSTGNIEDKEGLHWLEPHQKETVSYFIQVH